MLDLLIKENNIKRNNYIVMLKVDLNVEQYKSRQEKVEVLQIRSEEAIYNFIEKIEKFKNIDPEFRFLTPPENQKPVFPFLIINTTYEVSKIIEKEEGVSGVTEDKVISCLNN